ncbi:hypothetical protein ABPG75_004344 [Micractinium tetrahymenae]
MASLDQARDQLDGLADRLHAVEGALRRHVNVSLLLRRNVSAAAANVSLHNCANLCGMAGARIEQLGLHLVTPAETTPTVLVQRSIADAAVQRFGTIVEEEVQVLEELSVPGTQPARLQQAADRVLHECAGLADILSTHAPIYVDELPGMAAIALGLLGKVARGVADMPEELASLIWFCNASFDKAEAAARIVDATSVGGCSVVMWCFSKLHAQLIEYMKAAPADQAAAFEGITKASRPRGVYDYIMAVPVEALASLRSSGYGFSLDFPEAAAAMQPLVGPEVGGQCQCR